MFIIHNKSKNALKRQVRAALVAYIVNNRLLLRRVRAAVCFCRQAAGQLGKRANSTARGRLGRAYVTAVCNEHKWIIERVSKKNKIVCALAQKHVSIDFVHAICLNVKREWALVSFNLLDCRRYFVCFSLRYWLFARQYHFGVAQMSLWGASKRIRAAPPNKRAWVYIVGLTLAYHPANRYSMRPFRTEQTLFCIQL